MRGGTLKVFEELAKGPATTSDIADELNIERRLASAFLSKLRKNGLAESYGKVGHEHAGKPQNLWRIIE